MSLSISQIDEYMKALVTNVKDLLRESELLFRKKAYARSYTLAHIVREEAAKCHILYAAGRRQLAGIDVDWKVTMRRLRDHKSKLKQEIASNGTSSLLFGGSKQVFEDSMHFAQRSSKQRNDYKNNSLYVGLSSDGEITQPNKVIDKDRAQKNIELARFAINNEVKLQNKIGSLKNIDRSTMPDISFVDSMDKEQPSELLKQLADTFDKYNEK